MPFDRLLRWTGTTLLAIVVGLLVVVACGPSTPTPQPDDVVVDITTVGPGAVWQPSSDFTCRGACTWTGPAEKATGFLAAPDGANAFVAWTGACHTLDATCTRLLGDGDAATATFAPHALRLRLTGDGEGEFRIEGPGIGFGCTEDCAVGLPQPILLAITYYKLGSTETILDNWGGACAGAVTNYCLVNVNGATDVIKTWRRPPVAFDEVYATTRNAPLSVSAVEGVLRNVIDTPGDTHTAERVTNVTRGTLDLAADGGFSYTPNVGFAGSDTFTYRARDAFGNMSRTATVTITVINRPPEAVANSYFTALNTPVTVPAPGVLANDRDPDGDALTIVDPTPVTDGTLALEPDGGFTYTPPDRFIGLATFTYRVSDGLATSNPATVTFGVGLDAPVAADNTYATFRNQALSVDAEDGVLANDADPEGRPLSAERVDDVSHGSLVLAPNGSFTYEPDEGFVGPDTFTYRASNGETSSVVATVTITITNRAPIAVNDPGYTTTRNATLTIPAPGVLTNDGDPDGDPLTANLLTTVTNGNLTLNADGSFGYTPNTGFAGTDTFTYVANDGVTNSNTATVTITVINRAPIAVNDPGYTTTRNATLTIPAPGVLTNDSDPDGDPLTAVRMTPPEHGELALDADGSFTYAPDDGFAGTDTFTYVANDGLTNSNIATVTITVINRAPIAVNDTYDVDAGETLTIDEPGVLNNDSDPDGDPLTANLLTTVTNGNLTLNANGSFGYTPNTGFAGTDTFAYVANDGLTNSNTARVTITVAPTVTSVRIDQPNTSLIVDDTLPLTATVTTTGSASQNVTWTSSNPSAATINSSGLVTALAPGTTTITATSTFDTTKSDTITIEVTLGGP